MGEAMSAGRKGLDGRSRNQDGRIREKRGDTLAGTLKRGYPEFDAFRDSTRLDILRDRYHADSLDDLRRKLRSEGR